MKNKKDNNMNLQQKKMIAKMKTTMNMSTNIKTNTKTKTYARKTNNPKP